MGTADVHYLGREDYNNHSALLCVQTKSTIAEPKLTFDTNEFYLKDSAEMEASFAEWPEAVPTSLEIAERCHVEIELGKMLIPSYATPERRGPRAPTCARSPRRACAGATATRRRPRRSSGWRWSSR